MSFYKKYELERLIADGEAKTFRAVENATGRTVFLHLVNPQGQAIFSAFKKKLDNAGGQSAPVVEVGEFAGSPYAVTEVIEPFTSFRDWVNSWTVAQSAPPPAPLPPSPPAPAPLPEAGDFTRLFQSAPPSQNPSPVPPGEFTRQFQAPAARRNPPAPQVSTPETEAGEFTRLFAAPPRPPTPLPKSPTVETAGEFERIFQNPPASRNTPSPAAEQPAELDEFERMTRGRAEPAPPVKPADPVLPFPASSPDSEPFTPLFGSGLPGEAIDVEQEQARAARSMAPENRPFRQAGEFTRMFGTPAGQAAPPPPVSPANASASGLFSPPEELSRMADDILGKAPQLAGSEPGEYTRMFGPSVKQPEQPAAEKPAPPAAAPPPEKKRNILLISAIAGAVALIVALVLVLVLKKG